MQNNDKEAGAVVASELDMAARWQRLACDLYGAPLTEPEDPRPVDSRKSVLQLEADRRSLLEVIESGLNWPDDASLEAEETASGVGMEWLKEEDLKGEAQATEIELAAEVAAKKEDPRFWIPVEQARGLVGGRKVDLFLQAFTGINQAQGFKTADLKPGMTVCLSFWRLIDPCEHARQKAAAVEPAQENRRGWVKVSHHINADVVVGYLEPTDANQESGIFELPGISSGMAVLFGPQHVIRNPEKRPTWLY